MGRVDHPAGFVPRRDRVLPGGGIADANGGRDGAGGGHDLTPHDRRGSGGLEAQHAAAPGTWLLALRKVDISYAYPFIALGFVLVLGLSSWFLDERLNAARLLGVALIVGGVFCVARS